MIGGEAEALNVLDCALIFIVYSQVCIPEESDFSLFVQTCIYSLNITKTVFCVLSKLKEWRIEITFQSNAEYLAGLCMYLQNSLFIEINLDSF